MRSLKTQLHKIQFGGFLRAFLSKSFEQLIKAVASLAKNILLSFGLTVPASTVDAVIKMKINGLGVLDGIIELVEVQLWPFLSKK